MPYIFHVFLPANIGATGCLLFWIKAPARKKQRWRAALASLLVVPCMLASGVLSLFYSPIPVWQVFGALSALAFIVAVWAIVRVKRKANHPWADYYKQVTIE